MKGTMKPTLRAEKGTMTNKPLKNGQKVLIIKDNPRGYARVGDLAIQTGWDGKQNQFHDTYMQPSYNRDENYWVEELDDDCYIVLNDAQAQQEAVEIAYRQGISDFVHYSYIDWDGRSGSARGTVDWIEYVVRKLKKFRKSETSSGEKE